MNESRHQKIFPFARVGFYGKRPIDGQELRRKKQQAREKAKLLARFVPQGTEAEEVDERNQLKMWGE